VKKVPRALVLKVLSKCSGVASGVSAFSTKAAPAKITSILPFYELFGGRLSLSERIRHREDAGV
jgi:hypothetical protein